MTTSHASPPKTLDEDLEVGCGDWPIGEFYHLTTALVIPRPIGWISTVSAQGVRNLAPYSYFNVMGTDPSYVAFGSVAQKDTLTNILEVPEFVCNIATVDLLGEVEFTATAFPRGEDECEWARLTAVPSRKVRPSRVAQAKAHLECEVAHIHRDGKTNIVLGRVVHAHVSAAVWRDGRVDPRLLDPLARLGGAGYARLGELFSIKRATVDEVRAKNGEHEMPRPTRHPSD